MLLIGAAAPLGVGRRVRTAAGYGRGLKGVFFSRLYVRSKKKRARGGV